MMHKESPGDLPKQYIKDTGCKVYIREGCGYCSAAVSFLQAKQIPFTILNRDEDDFSQDWFEEEFGVFATYPQVIMWNKAIGGYTDLLQYAEECMEGVGSYEF